MSQLPNGLILINLLIYQSLTKCELDTQHFAFQQKVANQKTLQVATNFHNIDRKKFN